MKLIGLALASVVTLSAAAQTATPTPGKNDYNIHQREVDQRKRIEQGVDTGQLTRGEQKSLNRQERGLNREVRGMRAQDNGHLTAQDRRTLHQQQNQESRRIARDKHNGRKQ